MTGRRVMTEEQEELLRSVARSWLTTADQLGVATADPVAQPSDVMKLADEATLARMRFHQTLVELGWTPPGRADQPGA